MNNLIIKILKSNWPLTPHQISYQLLQYNKAILPETLERKLHELDDIINIGSNQWMIKSLHCREELR